MLPAAGEDVSAYLTRCRPSSARLALGAVAASFHNSQSDLVEVAKQWLDAYDGQSSMLAFGAARGLTFGAWEVRGVIPAEADAVWAMAVGALTTGQLGVYCTMAPQDDDHKSWTLRIGTPDFQDKLGVDAALAGLRSMGYSAACDYTAVTYQRHGDDCTMGRDVVWRAAEGATVASNPISPGLANPAATTVAVGKNCTAKALADSLLADLTMSKPQATATKFQVRSIYRDCRPPRARRCVATGGRD